MNDNLSAANGKNQKHTFDGRWLTLRGSVENLLQRDGSRLLQVVIEGAEPLYREIRIPNPFQDANGNIFSFQGESEVEITIKVPTRM
jgi:hypothetical protein